MRGWGARPTRSWARYAAGAAAGLLILFAVAPAAAEPPASRAGPASQAGSDRAPAAHDHLAPEAPTTSSEKAKPKRQRGVYEHDVVEVNPAANVSIQYLHVDNRLGNVRIEGHDRSTVIISAFKRASNEAVLERLKVTLVPDPTGPVRIATAIAPGRQTRPIPSGTVAIDLVIRAPRSARVDARVWTGQLGLVGMENGAELHANNGDIDVKNASGTIVTHMGTGNQQITEVFGAVDAQTIAGSMDLDEIRGERLDASVHEGHIDGRQVRVRYASIHTIKGDIRLRGYAVAGGYYQVGTYRGHLEVALVRSAPISLTADARAGVVSLPSSVSSSLSSGNRRSEIPVTGFWPQGNAAPAIVDLRSRLGNIRFSLVE